MNKIMDIQKKILDEYNLVCKVYENYFEFENYLGFEIKNFQSDTNTLNILEIGTGTGITTDIILNSRNNIKLITLDHDINAIKLSKKRFSNKNIEFIHIDALEFITHTSVKFDIVVSAFTIHNFNKEYRHKFYEVLNRTMNKNAIFLNADKYSPDDDIIRTKSLKYIINKYFNIFLEKNQKELLKEWVLHYIDDQSNDKVLKVEESKKNMEKYGYKDINILYKDTQKMLAILKAKKNNE